MATMSPLSFTPLTPSYCLAQAKMNNVSAFFTAITSSNIASNTHRNQISSPKKTITIEKIPGDQGLPVIGPISDRNECFNIGRDEFFNSRIRKYSSTVFRVNMPPGPPISTDPCVVALLDGKSFPVLFDSSKVDKKDVFTGTYTPSLDLTGGYRVLSYLDPSEPSHQVLKQLMFKLVTTTHHRVIPEFRSAFSELFNELDNELGANGKAKFNDANEKATFNFLSRAWLGADPAEFGLGDSTPGIINKWILFQLGPILTLGLPKPVEESTIHSFRLPFCLIKKDYQKLYDFIYQNSGPILNEAARLGISRDEACHNLVFTLCFNSFGGIKIFFPNMVKQVGRAGFTLHRRLAEEIRSAVRSNGGKLTMPLIEEQMPLLKSVVYEALRVEPPIPLQYGRAKKDFVIESHKAAFQVKKGEMLFGYQTFATKDPKIFDRAEEFVPDRFVGDGERFLKHVVWSNGPENGEPTVHNKQCAGKEFVVLVSRLFLVELFLRYDAFKVDVGYSPLGAKVTFTSVKSATF